MSLAKRFLGSPWAVEEVWKEVERDTDQTKKRQAVDLPLSNDSKRLLAFDTSESEKLSTDRIGSETLLLCLIREKTSIAAKILHSRGVSLEPTRAELVRLPHNDSNIGEFVRQNSEVPDGVVLLRNRIRSIRDRIQVAISSSDFSQARALSDEEREVTDQLYSLCRRHDLPDWLYI